MTPSGFVLLDLVAQTIGFTLRRNQGAIGMRKFPQRLTTFMLSESSSVIDDQIDEIGLIPGQPMRNMA